MSFQERLAKAMQDAEMRNAGVDPNDKFAAVDFITIRRKAESRAKLMAYALAFAIGVGSVLLLSACLMGLWNWVVPSFGGPIITYTQSLGVFTLLTFVRLLLK